jgi:DNA-binding transcriptional LysR family regulator
MHMAPIVDVMPSPNLDWDDLRHLRAALRAGSLASAARDLRVEHTTIGRRLTALEEALGTTLVVRTPTGLHATATGSEVAPLLDDIARAVEAIVALAHERRSHVRLATPSGFAVYFAGAIAALRKAHPDVTLELVSGARLVDLQRGQADLAVRVGPVVDKSLVARRVGVAGWALYGAPRYRARVGAPIDLDDLSGHDVIGFEGDMTTSPAGTWLETHAQGATIVLRSREMVDARDAAASGVGLAVLPCAIGDPHPMLERLTPTPIATQPMFLVSRRDARRSSAVRAVVKLVVDVLAQRAEELAGTRRQ